MAAARAPGARVLRRAMRALALLLLCALALPSAAREANPDAPEPGGGQTGKGAVPLDERLVQAVVASHDPWFIKFYAPWCMHCKQVAPTWDKLAFALHPDVKVAKVDASKYEALANTYKIRGFPTMILFDGKGSMWRYKGKRSVSELRDFAHAVLAGNPPPTTEQEGLPWAQAASHRMLIEQWAGMPLRDIAIFSLLSGSFVFCSLWIAFRPRGNVTEMEVDRLIAELRQRQREKLGGDHSADSDVDDSDALRDSDQSPEHDRGSDEEDDEDLPATESSDDEDEAEPKKNR